MKELCALCKAPANQKCGGCKTIFYCSREHQKAHWKEHSQTCKCYKLVVNEKLGRHYIASRVIKAGEIVIREDEALVRGPEQETEPVCLGCSSPLVADKAKPCEQCGWPLCSGCNKHGPECEFTQRYKDSKVSISGFGIKHPTYECITIVRALCLRETNPEAYKRFMNLSSGSNEADFVEPHTIARFIKRFFNKLTDIGEDEIARVAGILQINGHEVPITEPYQLGVYDAASYLEHSCKANCSKTFTESGGIIIRAAAQIEKGEHITISYTDGLWGAVNRQHHLSSTKFFECTCPRCSDPTEFGTMFNAIKCTRSDCNGYMLPKTFLAKKVPDYKCDKCDNAVSASTVNEMTERIGREIVSMKRNDIDACRAFIKKYTPKIHDNHFYMTDVKLALAQLIGTQSGGLAALDTEVLSEKILMFKQLNDLFRIIIPAENRVRGLVLFEMHVAITEFSRRQDKEYLYGFLQESKRMLIESHELLKYEPKIFMEGKLASTMKKNMRELDIIMKNVLLNTVASL